MAFGIPNTMCGEAMCGPGLDNPGMVEFVAPGTLSRSSLAANASESWPRFEMKILNLPGLREFWTALFSSCQAPLSAPCASSTQNVPYPLAWGLSMGDIVTFKAQIVSGMQTLYYSCYAIDDKRGFGGQDVPNHFKPGHLRRLLPSC